MRLTTGFVCLFDLVCGFVVFCRQHCRLSICVLVGFVKANPNINLMMSRAGLSSILYLYETDGGLRPHEVSLYPGARGWF